MKHIVFRQFFRDFCSAAIYPAVFLLSVALLVLLSAGCSRDDEVSGKKIGKGGAVQFTATGGTPSAITKSSAGSSSENEVEQTYTIYYDFEKGENVAAPQGGVSHGSAGNLTQSSDTKFSGEVFESAISGVYAERLDWVAGDKITIAQKGDALSSNTYDNLYSDYKVENPESNRYQSTATLTPVAGNGLQWREGENYFAALYPSATELGLTIKPTNMASGPYYAYFEGGPDFDYMPSDQYCTLVGSRNYQDKTGSTKTETWYAPNMRYAYMVASANVSTGFRPVLRFHPNFSSVEVKLVKPSSLSGATVKLKSAVLTGGSGASDAASLSGNPTLTTKKEGVNSSIQLLVGVENMLAIGGSGFTYGNSITMGFKKSDGTTDDSPVLEEAGATGAKPVSFTFLMLPVTDITQLELTLTLEVTKGGIAKTETKKIKLKDAAGWIDLPAGKKLTITNMSTWIVVPSTFTERTFTVSADGKKVKFSSGNLQAVIAEGHDNSAEGARWQFADRQYQYPSRADGDAYSADAGKTVDLFMHPESGDVTVPYAFGIPVTNAYSTSTTTTFEDWGEHLNIYPNSTSSTPYVKNIYRTLTRYEWAYLLVTRESGATVGGTSNARYSRVTLNVGGTTGTISGLLIYPDGFTWTSAMGTAPVVNSLTSDFNTSSAYTLAQFEAMESAGVVFLPAAGQCNNNGNFNYVAHGYYWSADLLSESSAHAHMLDFRSGSIGVSSGYRRYDGYSVRLVKDVN